MIKSVNGNLLDAKVEALVNTVNTVGVMGKGIALQFRQALPENYEFYRKACARDEVRPGHMLVFDRGQRLDGPRYVVNFPTKRHWKGRTKIEDIESGLIDLIDVIKNLSIKSVAVPPLGCGNGGLNWTRVKPLIERAFLSVPDVIVHLYEPMGAPNAGEMKIATPRPHMTGVRAALLILFENYLMPGYQLSLLEIQKLAYFLQESGNPMNLRFVRNQYGPYAENLHHVLQRIDGHFIKGYGDRTERAQTQTIQLIPDAIAEAHETIGTDSLVERQLNVVSNLIEGYEYPGGLELLATVHWVTKESELSRTDVAAAIRAIHEWSDRKKALFPEDVIEMAWNRLREMDWFEGDPVSE